MTEPQNAQQQEVLVDIKPDQTVIKFEEYKLFIEDTARLSERRQTVTNTYITVNGAIVALLTFMFKDAGFTNVRIVLAVIPVIIAGIIVCYFWLRLLSSYKRLVGFRFAQLEEMEKEIPGSHRMYYRETESLYSRAPKNKQISQSKIEMRLPWLFGGLYVGIFVVACVLLAFTR